MKKRLLCCLLAAFILTGSVLMLSPRSRAADDMTTSDQLIDVLKKMEGFAPRAFWDHSQWTVGYGTRCPNDMLSRPCCWTLRKRSTVSLTITACP